MHIIPLINHHRAFSLMRAQPSGPPPERADGDDHVITYHKYSHVHERILLLCEDNVRTSQNPFELVFRIRCHHERYVLLLLVVVTAVEILAHEIDGSLEEIVRCDYA